MSVRIILEKDYVLLESYGTMFSDDDAKKCLELLKQSPEARAIIAFSLPDAEGVSHNALRTLTRAFSSATQGETRIGFIARPEVAKFVREQGLERIFRNFSSMDELLEAYGKAPGRKRTLEFLNTTLEATINTLQVSTNTKCVPGKTFKRGESSTPQIAIAATVGLVSAPFHGALILAFPEPTYLKLMSRMLSTEYTEMKPEIRDGAAELLNIILGQVKISLNEKGFAIKQAIPTVVHGKELEVMPSSAKPSVIIPYTSDSGDFYIELTTDPETKAA